MKTFSTSGTGNQQTLSEIESDKMPIYDSVADAEADLANLSVGQLVATKDTGTELSQPVDAVQSGNMHAVTSNAVAGLIKQIDVTFSTDADGITWILDKYAKGLINAHPKTGELQGIIYNIQLMAPNGITPNGLKWYNVYTGQAVANATFDGIITYLDF